jgi:magnesium transporter
MKEKSRSGNKRKYRFVSGKKKGLPPGTLVHTGDDSLHDVQIHRISYSSEHHEASIISSYDDIAFAPSNDSLLWYDFIGVHDKAVLEKIGSIFNLHPLVLEDIMNISQRPKIEEYDNYLYIVIRRIHDSSAGEQISMVVGDNFVLTFQEHYPDSLLSVKAAIGASKAKLRFKNTDYLAYRIIDLIIDEYFMLLEGMGERIETLEEEVTSNPQRHSLTQIHGLKRELILVRRTVWPAREVISRLARSDSGIVHDDTKLYLRDVYDHTVQVIDTVESYRDIVTSLLDIYLSSISNRMGEVMKVLTIIATIFIPLTFIAGVYGMNFHNMPELEWEYGYFAVLGVMGAIMVGMLLFFRRKGWV